MGYLPVLSGKQVVSCFERLGYRVVRQRGSHMRLICGSRKPLTVPDHKTIGPGLSRTNRKSPALARGCLPVGRQKCLY